MKPWLGTSEFLTDSAEQALLEQRGREILAQQARREARKTAAAKGKGAQGGEADARPEQLNPLETRKVISEGIAAANHAPIEKAYNVGVIQV